MNAASTAEINYDKAIRAITGLEEQLTGAAAQLQALKADRDLSDEGRRSKVATVRETTIARYRSDRDEITKLLEVADREANTAIVGDPTDTGMEGRKSRAGTRVARLINGGMTVTSAAEVFTEAGDLDALRALRDEIPSVVASVDPQDRLGARVRSQRIREVTITVDAMMAPLLPEPEGRAARLRGNIETAQDWVRVLGEDTIKTLNGRGTGLSASSFHRDMLVEV